MKRPRLVLGVTCVFLLGAIMSCTSNVQKERGQLNLDYQFKSAKEPKKDYSIGIVKADIPSAKGNQKQTTQPALHPMVAAAMQQQGVLPATDSVIVTYNNELRQKLSSGIEELITRKGFTVSGPYDSFEDMTFRDKQKVFLAMIPRLNLLPENKITNRTTNAFTNVTYTTGVIQMGGDYIIDFVEPLTKEKLMSKRINLSDLGIQKEYVSERKGTSPSGIMGLASQAATSGQTYTDNYEKAITDAINEFYSKSMSKLEVFIDSEEIVSYQEDVTKLKGMKRF